MSRNTTQENSSHTFKMTFDQAVLVHKVVNERTQALKNWIASAVESDDTERARKLVQELREYEKLYSAFNVVSKKDTAEYSGRPMKTDHEVRG